ncbi:hypothetical protein NE237_013450 [Protea cynaroides]|uniref:Uncharacterized protein n=1 Tax=Protea cynaroides TaxID=273540 RepID=A0A9Q0H312_9MAGN|nr:hypothetical protein NE237_013450 [Protea cynaroides]
MAYKLLHDHRSFSGFSRHHKKNRPKNPFLVTANIQLQKTLKSFPKSNHWMHEVIIKEEGLAKELRIGHKGYAAAHAGNKVLSKSDSTVPTVANDQCGSSEKKDKPKGEKTKTISRMKELLRWASAAKAEKGGKYISRKVLNVRNHGVLKSAAHDDNSSLSSSKTSSRWDVGSCSTSSSAYSGFSSVTSSSTRTDQTQIKPIISYAAEDVSVPDSNAKQATTSNQDSELCTSRRENWITTDGDCKILCFLHMICFHCNLLKCPRN